MTLSQLIAHALRQLDENAEDVSEYEESFKVYANMGYDIAVREYLKPRRTFCVDVDEKGNAPVPGLLVTRVVELRDEYGRDVGYDLDPDGRGLHIWRVDLAGKTRRMRGGVLPDGGRERRAANPGMCAGVSGGLHLLSASIQRQSGQAETGAVLSEQLPPGHAAAAAAGHGQRDALQAHL